MGEAMRLWAVIGAALFVACEPYSPCGWDGALEQGRQYDVELVERYVPGSRSALYLAELDLNWPAPSCAGADGIDAGDTITIEMVQAPSPVTQRCSFWFADVVEPALELGTRNPGLLNNRSHNQIDASGQLDLGGGCVGWWEFSVHAHDDDPFAEQIPGGVPVTVAYRVFIALPDAADACAAHLGTPPLTEPRGFTCGDAFVARMRRR